MTQGNFINCWNNGLNRLMKKSKFKQTEIGIDTSKKIFRFTVIDIKERLAYFQKMYYSLEANTMQILEYIPLDSPDETYSLKFISVISLGVNCIEDILRILVFRSGVDDSYYDLFKNVKNKQWPHIDLSKKEDIKYIQLPKLLKFLTMIYNQKITIEKISLILNPFQVKELIPFKEIKWYDEYNQFKHTQFENRRKATLKNSVTTLAAFYICYNILLWELHRLEQKKKIQWHECIKPRNSFGLAQYQLLYLESRLFGSWFYDGVD